MFAIFHSKTNSIIQFTAVVDFMPKGWQQQIQSLPRLQLPLQV
jgi:hypothetical protein